LLKTASFRHEACFVLGRYRLEISTLATLVELFRGFHQSLPEIPYNDSSSQPM